jgi:ribonuclease HII
MIVGIDEAGRGPLAGVVTACALHLKSAPPFIPKDSKQLSPTLREEYFFWLIENAVYGLGQASHEEIDRHNILVATFMAFDRAINSLLEKAEYLKGAQFIVDGNRFKTSLAINYKCVVKADQTVPEVSCASIVAKVTRDKQMEQLAREYPLWQFEKHKGYPTKEHIELINKHGLSPIHRKSFGPCQIVSKKYE